MNKRLLTIATKKFQKLSKKDGGFINVIFDNWRGFRFIFDTKDVRKCNNDCKRCSLYKLLEKEGISKNCFGLFPATRDDKKLFGPQNFLNCKTLNQYKKCFINFILKKTKKEKKIRKELFLVKNFKIIFSKNKKSISVVERELKKEIIRKVSSKMPNMTIFE